MLVSVGAGAFAGYDYCSKEGLGSALRDCATDAAVNIYRTSWGSRTAHPSDTSSTGTVEEKTFYSEALDREMRYVVYLPPGYDDPQNSSTRYPVVYLLHGRPGEPEDWMDAGGVAEQMDELLAQGQARPMILVAPQGSLGYDAHGTGYVDGPLGDWGTYMTRDLVEEIDSNYRSVASKDGRAIAGLSEGGYGATNLGLKNPSEYGVIGSFSGYFTIDHHDLSKIFGGDKGLADANSPATYFPQLGGGAAADLLLCGGRR